MRTLFAGALCLVILATPAPALEAAAPATKADHLETTVVRAFLGLCVLNMPNIDIVRSTARVLKWRPLTGDLKAALGPVGQGNYDGWFARENEIKYLVGTSYGDADGRRVVGCTVYSRYGKPALFLQKLTQSLRLTLIQDATEAGQRVRSWKTNVIGQSMILFMTSLAEPQEVGVTLSVTMFK